MNIFFLLLRYGVWWIYYKNYIKTFRNPQTDIKLQTSLVSFLSLFYQHSSSLFAIQNYNTRRSHKRFHFRINKTAENKNHFRLKPIIKNILKIKPCNTFTVQNYTDLLPWTLNINPSTIFIAWPIHVVIHSIEMIFVFKKKKKKKEYSYRSHSLETCIFLYILSNPVWIYKYEQKNLHIQK